MVALPVSMIPRNYGNIIGSLEKNPNGLLLIHLLFDVKLGVYFLGFNIGPNVSPVDPEQKE